MRQIILIFAAILAVSANSLTDTIWMEMMSAQFVEAEAQGQKVRDSKNIPALAGDLGLTELVKLVTDAGLAEALSGKGPLTVFGPTNKAFEALPKPFVQVLLKNKTLLADILKYHVIQGKVLAKNLENDLLVPSLQGSDIRINLYKNNTVATASGRVISKADQIASNGVIHVVDGVLFPAPGTLTDVVAKCPAFSTLLKAVQAAGLAETLAGKGPYTLFAPSNRAFKRIPAPCLKKLIENKKLLTKVLLYHVVPSTEYSAGLSCGDSLKTAEGSSVFIKKMWGHVKVNDACVVYPDATVTNGVMHMINRVLFPRGMEDFCPEGAMDYDDSEDDKTINEIPFIY